MSLLIASARSHLLPLGSALMLAIAAVLFGGCARPGQREMATAAFDPTYDAWSALLARFVAPEGVDYARLKQDPSLLRRAQSELQAVGHATFEAWPRNARLAFLINAHNLFAIARIVRHYPVRSIGETRKIGAARAESDISLLGRNWSLSELAETVTGPEFNESRAAFLLNWTARGCPELPPVAVTQQNVEQMLERQTRRFLDSPHAVRYEWKRHLVFLSPLIGWHREELERDFTTIWAFLERYLPPEDARRLKARPPRIDWLEFDARLNAVFTEAPRLPG